jgi:hypothetical protein
VRGAVQFENIDGPGDAVQVWGLKISGCVQETVRRLCILKFKCAGLRVHGLALGFRFIDDELQLCFLGQGLGSRV